MHHVAAGRQRHGQEHARESARAHASAQVGELSRALASGRHTTTSITWYWLDGTRRGALIDSPGFQEFGLHHIQPMRLATLMLDLRAASVAPRRFILLLVSSFGLLALLLATVGVYRVMALVVGERTREVGVRLALGAQPGTVLRMVLGQATRLAFAGVVAGPVPASLLSPLLEHQLFGIRPYDPVDFKEAKQLLINYKQLFKQFENPEAYTNFKEVMRILRKIKYENKT